MNRRIRTSGLHFLISAGIAVLAGSVVFFLWYPPPYSSFAGGLTLFAMLVGIDVVVGPCLTAVIAGPSKPKGELQRDIGVIALLQLVAFGYGMYTIAMARPVHLVFEVDRFRVVSAADIEPEQLEKALPRFQQLPWTGPTLIGTRKSASQAEMARSLDLGLQGADVAMQPGRWVDYAAIKDSVLLKARPAAQLLEKYPQEANAVRAVAAGHGVALQDLRFLPLEARKASGVALVASPDARIVGYLAVEGFF